MIAVRVSQVLSCLPWTHRLAATLTHFLWQGGAIAFVYAICRNRLGRTRTAEFRYLLACCALAAMAAAPVVTFIFSTAPRSARATIGVSGSVASSEITSKASWRTPTGMEGSRTWCDSVEPWVVAVWLAGCVVFAGRFLGGWAVATRMRSTRVRPAPAEWQTEFDRIRRRLRLSRPVRLLVSGAAEVPVVVGYLQPLVLVPVGALTGLPPSLLRAILIHELAHVRRNDYLAAILQAAVEAALFYHPAVWWVSNHLREERELCCDDIAVASCGDPIVYARALAELESSRTAHLQPALSANGSSLPQRIAHVLNQSRPPLSGMHGTGAILAGLLAATGIILAQRVPTQPAVVAASALPAFEVASIKPSEPDSPLKIEFARGGRLFVSHATLRFLIKIAYDVNDDQITGGPAWFGSQRFDIQAKPDKQIPGDPEKMTKDEILLFHRPTRLRLQRLLAERFHLELRKESRPMPILALIVGKKGVKMRRSRSTGDPVLAGSTGHGMLIATRVDMDTLAHFLSEGQTSRPVVNMTDLSGIFDFQLEWTPDPSFQLPADPTQPTPADDGGISIFTALQQQLGLKLEARTGTAETLAVTRAELPSEN